MAQILFLIGAVLIFMGKIRIANIDAEGPKVRAAGFMLMMPLIAVVLLSIVVSFMSSGETEFSGTLLLILELAILMTCVGVAYSLLRGPNPAVGKTDDEPATPAEKPDVNQPRQKTSIKQPAPKKPAARPSANRPVLRPFPASNPQNAPQGSFPTVMNTAEAATYLKITEQDVLRLIEDGKLVAAKINYRYRISRSVLDEFIEEQRGGSSTPAME